jgi:YVTN family beta-propeller protein
LRKALGAERIRTSGPGYLLELAQDELDLERFERLVEEARELRGRNEPALASGALREALALWRGSPLADLADEPFAEPEIARLEGLRLGAIEERIDLDLALGRGAELVPELETLVARNPYRERLCGQLMLALYRAGRQAEALAAHQRARQLFVDELGIEPSPALQRLEQAILRQESGLEALLEAVEEDPEPPEEEPLRHGVAPRGSRLRRPLVAVVGLVLAGVVVAALAVGLAGKTTYRDSVDASAVGIIDPDAARIEDQIQLEAPANGIASDGETVWLADTDAGTVSRIGPDRRSFQSSPVLGSADGIAYGWGSLWVTNSQRRALLQLNPNTMQEIQAFRVGNGPRAVKVGDSAVWVVNSIDGTVSRIGRDGVPGKPIPVGPSPVGIAIGGGGVWVTSEESGDVMRIDPQSSHVVEPIPSGRGAGGIAYGDGAVWVANRDDGTVSRIDPATNTVTNTIDGFDKPEALVFADGWIWVANAGDGTITRIDPESPDKDKTVTLGSLANGLAGAGGKLWASTVAEGGHRGGVLKVELVPSDCRCVDPVGGPVELTQLVFDGLVAYRRVGGTAGERLVPNLAERIQAPTDEGKTYTFQLRRGLRYSNGAAVRASDFRYSLERLMRLDQWRPGLYGSIRGATACTEQRCDLSRGIEVDDRSGTIVIRLKDADPELLHKLALPPASVVPLGTPVREATRHPIASIGPYRVASITPREVTLIRNRHFRPWATEARPDGYADEIRVRFRNDPKAQLAAVKRGASDWVDVGHVTPAEMKGLKTRYASRLLTNPASSQSYWFFLNTRVPPFNDPRARQAVNYAIDRRLLIELNGEIGEPSCQILPPVLPGYRPHCPYTRDPNAAGTWTAPDLAKARALVRASGTRGMHVEVDMPGLKASLGDYVASVLRKIGFESSVRRFADVDEYYPYVGDSRNGAQIGWAGWVPDILSASNFLQLFRCDSFIPKSNANLNLFEFCDPALDAKMEHAAQLQGSEADELWAQVDRELVEQAVAVPWSIPRTRVLVSERVGNVQGHPLWGTLLDQLWVE